MRVGGLLTYLTPTPVTRRTHGDDPVTDALDGIVATANAWSQLPSPGVVAELQNLVQAYALFADCGRGDDLADLFTEDAAWDGTELGYGSAQGPAAIAATVLEHYDPARPMIHLPGPPLLVELSDERASGVCWCLATRSTGGAPSPLIFFYYDDEFRRDGASQWRFARRTLRLRFRSDRA